MDKQRLLELAGITEARTSGWWSGPTTYIVTAENNEDYEVGEIFTAGPFHSRDDAHEFTKHLRDYFRGQSGRAGFEGEREFNIDDFTFQVQEITPPADFAALLKDFHGFE